MNFHKTQKTLENIFNKIPLFGYLLRSILEVLADVLLFLSRKLGDLYTLLFGFLGTSWYNHKFDYLRGAQNYHWLERVFFVMPKISKEDSVLDIGCGDGIYPGLFYSKSAGKILAVDVDKKAIKSAQRNYKKNNVSYVKKNILKWNIPVKTYDVITMFAVIEHFTYEDGQNVLIKVRNALKDGGTFLGSTPILKTLDIANWEHKNEFKSEEQLKSFLKTIFSKVVITKSVWSNERTECYFECRK